MTCVRRRLGGTYCRRNNKVKIKIIGITQDDEDGEPVKDG